MPPKKKKVQHGADGHRDSKQDKAKEEDPTTQPVQETLPPPPPTKTELLLNELRDIQIPRPRRIKSRELAGLLPHFNCKPSQPRLVVWTDLDYNAILRLDEAKSAEDIRTALVSVLALDDWKHNPKSQILLDLFAQVVDTAAKEKLNCEQTSAFFSIVKKIHDKTSETPVDNTTECLQLMDDLFCRHIVKRPPWSARIFDAHLAGKLRNFIIRVYFRYFQMYKFAFTPTVCMDASISYRKAAVNEPEKVINDPGLKDYFTREDMHLESILKEIDLEDAIEKAVAEGLPLPAAPESGLTKPAPQPGSALNSPPNPNPVEAETKATVDPEIAELEATVSKQLDKQLRFLREKLVDKFQKIDDIFVTNLGLAPEKDGFSAALLNPKKEEPPLKPAKKAKKGKEKK